MTNTTRRRLSALIALAPLGATQFAHAQDAWKPGKPIRLIVPFAPGGGGDTMARLTAPGVSARLGQPVVVENKAGANGAIASEFVFRSPGDGQTLLLATADTASIYPQMAQVAFDPMKFVPLAGVAEAPYVLVGRRDLPAGNLKQLQDLMKTQELSYSTPGAGSTMHLLTLALARNAGVKVLHVPFQGSGPATNALLAGTVDLCFFTVTSTIAHKDRVRIYGLATKERMVQIPEVPTLAEQGVPITGTSWLVWVAPPATSPAIAASIAKAVEETVSSQDVLKKIVDMGMIPIQLDQRAFEQWYAAEFRRWGDIIRTENLQIK